MQNYKNETIKSRKREQMETVTIDSGTYTEAIKVELYFLTTQVVQGQTHSVTLVCKSFCKL